MVPILLVLLLAILAAVLSVAGVAVLLGLGWALIAAGAWCAAGALILSRGVRANA